MTFECLSFLFKTISLCILCALSSVTPAHCDSSGTYNKKVGTFIDISSHLVNVIHRIAVVNNFTDPMNSYIFTIDPLWKDHFSYVGAHDSEGRALKVDQLHKTNNSSLRFNITLENNILHGESYTISVHSIYTHYLKSLPRKVKQGEQHLALFSLNVLFYSESLCNMQESFVNIGPNKLLSVDGEKYSAEFRDNSNLLKYGPYFDTPTFSVHLSTIHYSNKSPFLTVEELDRHILLSHWGYVNVWDKVLLVHSGPTFVGPYERPTENQQQEDTRIEQEDTRIESYTLTLPKDAFDIYIKDEIGVVWSYDIDDYGPDNILVTIRPRFVMYGGWKVRYEIGYTVALSNYLKKYSEYTYFDQEYFFDFPSIDLVVQNMVIDKARINIILPEGAKLTRGSENISDSGVQKYCYFLDTFCRKLISFNKYNLVEKHISNIEISYVHPHVFLFAKPLALSAYLFFILIVFIALSRLKSDSPSHSQPSKSNQTKNKTKKSNVPPKVQPRVTKKRKARKC